MRSFIITATEISQFRVHARDEQHAREIFSEQGGEEIDGFTTSATVEPEGATEAEPEPLPTPRRSIWIVVYGESYIPEAFATQEDAQAFADGSISADGQQLEENEEYVSGPWEIALDASPVRIEVRGGVAYLVSAPDGVQVEIVDHDNDEEGGAR